ALPPEHASYRGVHGRDRDTARADQGGEILEVDAAHHVHVDAGFECDLPRVGARAGDAVVPQLFDAGPVAHHEPGELPLVAQQRGHKPAVGVARDAADLVEGGHDAAGARLDCGVVRRQVDLPQGALGHVHGVVIPAPFGTAVCGEVLDGGHDGV